MSYLEFDAGDISPRSFTFGRAFHPPPKPPFSWFAVACVSCQGLPANWNRIIWSFILKEKQVVVWADCFQACAVPVENLWYIAAMKNWVKEGKKKTTFCMTYYQY